MIFIAGVYPKQKRLEYDFGVNICHNCGRYGRYEVYMEYSAFSLFFIPIIKWKKRYFVLSSCCNERFELDPEVGERIEKGEQVQIRQEDLHKQEGFGDVNHCKSCGQAIDPDFTYCPNCGARQK